MIAALLRRIWRFARPPDVDGYALSTDPHDSPYYYYSYLFKNL
jgi:hypothetical protein